MLTFDLERFPMPRYTRLSRRWTSVNIILSSRRLSSTSSVSIRARAGLYFCVSSCLTWRSVSAYFCQSEMRLTRLRGASPNCASRISASPSLPIQCCRLIRPFVFVASQVSVQSSPEESGLSGISINTLRAARHRLRT